MKAYYHGIEVEVTMFKGYRVLVNVPKYNIYGLWLDQDSIIVIRG